MRSRTHRVCVFLLSLSLLLLSSCKADSRESSNVQIPLRTLYISSVCGYDAQTPAVVEIRSQGELENAWRNIASPYPATARRMPDVRFTDEFAMLIYMGEKRTAGYSLGLASKEARLQNGVLELQLQWNEPPTGSMLAQVMTNPCMVLVLPRVPYTGVRVLDQHGKVRIERKD